MKKNFIFVLSLGLIFSAPAVYAEVEQEAPSHRINEEINRTLGNIIPVPEENERGVNPVIRDSRMNPASVSPIRSGVMPGRASLTQIASLVPPEDRIFGDLNGDGHVDFTDFKILVESFGPCPAVSSTSCPADLNNDRTVNTLDALLLLNNFTRYQEDLPRISGVLEKCQTVRASELQRRCLAVSMQEEEVSLRSKNVSPALVERAVSRAELAGTMSPEQIERGVEMRVRNYLKYMSNMLTRMTAAIERLNNLADRIESRIEKSEAEGQDLTQAKNLLAEARTKIEDASAKLTTVSQNYQEILTGENLTEEFARIRELVHNLRNTIQEAHQALVEVVISMRSQ